MNIKIGKIAHHGIVACIWKVSSGKVFVSIYIYRKTLSNTNHVASTNVRSNLSLEIPSKSWKSSNGKCIHKSIRRFYIASPWTGIDTYFVRVPRLQNRIEVMSQNNILRYIWHTWCFMYASMLWPWNRRWRSWRTLRICIDNAAVHR